MEYFSSALAAVVAHSSQADSVTRRGLPFLVGKVLAKHATLEGAMDEICEGLRGKKEDAVRDAIFACSFLRRVWFGIFKLENHRGST